MTQDRTTPAAGDALKARKPEDIVVEALESAERAGFVIRRGAVFDSSRRNGDLPWACNWLGAVLWMHDMMGLVGAVDSFAPDFLSEVCALIGASQGWVWRVTHGFDCGNDLTFLVVDREGNVKDTIKDNVSRWANRIGKRFAREPR